VTVNNGREDPWEVVAGLTDGLGADVAMEAVGVPPTFELAARLIRPGGRVANIGVHGEPVALHLEELWIRNVTVTTGLVDTYSTPMLLRLLAGHQLDAGRFVTHRFAMDEFMEAYDTFERAGDTGARQVVLPPCPGGGPRSARGRPHRRSAAGAPDVDDVDVEGQRRVRWDVAHAA